MITLIIFIGFCIHGIYDFQKINYEKNYKIYLKTALNHQDKIKYYKKINLAVGGTTYKPISKSEFIERSKNDKEFRILWK